MAFLRAGLLMIAALLSLSGCLPKLGGSAPPPDFYQLDYRFEPVPCARPFEDGVRIWPLNAASPYTAEQMVVIGSSNQVEPSQGSRWVAPPGQLVADMLLRDLSRSSLFPKVVGSGDPFVVPLALSGHLFTFAWERDGSSGRAVLDAEVSFWKNGSSREILFRKQYNFRSNPTGGNGPDQFAAAMSDVVRQFSLQLRRDICAIHTGS